MTSISFIGSGNLSGSLVRGLIDSGIDASSLAVTDRVARKAAFLGEKYPGITVCTSNREVAAGCEVLVACVKPGDMRGVCGEIAETLPPQSAPILVSVAAGVTLKVLAVWTKGVLPLVRCMPNTPVAVGYGMSVLCTDADLPVSRRQLLDRIFNAVGETVWIEDETLMDAVTALSGSGPAYFFRVMEILGQTAMKLGLGTEVAKKLVVQTALGAAQLAHRSTADAAELRRMVTSPGGTTEHALESLEKHGIDTMFEQAVMAAAERSRQIARDLEEKS